MRSTRSSMPRADPPPGDPERSAASPGERRPIHRKVQQYRDSGGCAIPADRATLHVMTRESLADARAFIEREGRLVERRLAEVLFDGADPVAIVDAVLAYRNADGGFGHGLEPDKRCPASLPIDVECALDILLVAGVDGTTRAGNVVIEACNWLDSGPTGDGAVPLSFPVMQPQPRADHGSDWTYMPGLNPT